MQRLLKIGTLHLCRDLNSNPPDWPGYREIPGLFFCGGFGAQVL